MNGQIVLENKRFAQCYYIPSLVLINTSSPGKIVVNVNSRSFFCFFLTGKVECGAKTIIFYSNFTYLLLFFVKQRKKNQKREGKRIRNVMLIEF